MTSEGFEQGLSQIKADLRAGRPVLVDISHDGIGHTLVVSGFDDKHRVLFFVDPDEAKPGRATASYEQFEAVWNETAYGGYFRAIIRTHEKRDQ